MFVKNMNISLQFNSKKVSLVFLALDSSCVIKETLVLILLSIYNICSALNIHIQKKFYLISRWKKHKYIFFVNISLANRDIYRGTIC